MPARLLRDWTDSDRLNALKPETERFFVRLIMKADDYGLYTANTRLLRASLFPLLLTEVTDADITRWLAQCQQAGILRLYQAQGKEYIEIINFGQRLRKARAKHPIPEDYGQYAAARGQLQPSHSEATTTGSGCTTTSSNLPASDGELTTTCGGLPATCGQLHASGGGLHATRGESPPIDGNSPPEVEVEYEVEVETEHSPLSPSGESAPPSAAPPLNVFDRTSQSPSPGGEGLGARLSPSPGAQGAEASPPSVAPAPQAPPLNVTGNTSQSPSPLGEGLEVRPSPSPGTQGAGASPPSVAPAPQSPPLNVTGNTSQSPSPLGEGLGVRQSPQTGYTGVLSPPNTPFANMYHNMGSHALFRPKTEDEVFKAWALLIPSLPTTALERRKALGDFIRQYRPVFIEPYATLWNLFALDNGLNQLHHLTERRRQKLSIRAREGPFDFVALLIQVKKSPFALGDNTRGWKIDFDYLLESESNYIKILEGKFEG